MEMPTDPAPYLEFTLLQFGLVSVVICLWARVSTDSPLASRLSVIATQSPDSN